MALCAGLERDTEDLVSERVPEATSGASCGRYRWPRTVHLNWHAAWSAMRPDAARPVPKALASAIVAASLLGPAAD